MITPLGDNKYRACFSGMSDGYNSRTDPYLLKDTESPDLNNIDLMVTGSINRRGSKATGETPQMSSTGLMAVWRWATDATSFIMAFDREGTLWRSLDGTSYTTVASGLKTNQTIGWTIMNNKLILADGSTTMFSYDGTNKTPLGTTLQASFSDYYTSTGNITGNIRTAITLLTPWGETEILATNTTNLGTMNQYMQVSTVTLTSVPDDFVAVKFYRTKHGETSTSIAGGNTKFLSEYYHVATFLRDNTTTAWSVKISADEVATYNLIGYYNNDLNDTVRLDPQYAGAEIKFIAAPICRYVHWWKDRLFGVYGNNRLYFSYFKDADRWTEKGYIDVGEDDNDYIVSLIKLNDELFVFKYNHIYKITGDNPTNFNSVIVTSGVGLRGDKCYTSIGDEIVFESSDGVFYRFNGSRLNQFSLNKIGYKDIPEGVTTGQEKNKAIVFNGNRLYIAYADDNNYNDTVLNYDFETDVWVKWKLSSATADDQLRVGCWFVNQDGALSYGDSRTGRVRSFNKYTTEGGAEQVGCHYETRWFDLGFPDNPKELGYMTVLAWVGGSATAPSLSCDIFFDGASSTSQTISITPTTTGYFYTIFPQQTTRFHMIKFKWSRTATERDFSLKRWCLNYNVEEPING